MLPSVCVCCLVLKVPARLLGAKQGFNRDFSWRKIYQVFAAAFFLFFFNFISVCTRRIKVLLFRPFVFSKVLATRMR